jgi:hypothetical protein
MIPPSPVAALAAWPSRLALQSDSSDDTLGLVAFFAVGLFLVYYGFRKWQQMRLIQDTPTEKVRSAAVGRTELSGVGKSIDGVGTIPQPFADGECLVATYEIEEWEEDHDPDDAGSDGHWQTLDSGTLFVPFELDDGTGAMRVEPEADATFDISEEYRTRIRVRPRRDPPAAVAAFIDRQNADGGDGGLFDLDLGDVPVESSEKRRYTQEVIPPGEELYLLGGVRPRDGAGGTNAERLVLGRDEGSDEFIISDKSQDELVSSYRWIAPGSIVAGLALSAVMLYLLLA